MRPLTILLAVLLLGACDDPTGPDVPMTGEWGVEAYAPGEGCSFYALVTLSGTRRDFSGLGENAALTGDRHTVAIDGHTLLIEGEANGRLYGSYTCAGSDGQWSMFRYGGS